MTPDKNQQVPLQADQPTSEPVSNQQASEYRPDWIFPETGTSSRDNNRPGNTQPGQPDNTNVPVDNDETLGIP